MFKFLEAPFRKEVQEKLEKTTSRTCHSVIVWESSKGIRIITASSATAPGRQQDKNQLMREWVDDLSSGNFDKIKKTLRAIARENTPKPRPKPFYSSFSGHGGSGVDGLW